MVLLATYEFQLHVLTSTYHFTSFILDILMGVYSTVILICISVIQLRIFKLSIFPYAY